MAWIMDTYSALKGNYLQPDVITGKPSQSVALLDAMKPLVEVFQITVREASKKLGINLKGAPVAIQGSVMRDNLLLIF